MKLHLVFLASLVAFNLVPAQEIQWQPWSDSVFSQAKQEGRFVLLDLGTGWCHWCHVMDNTTYRDPAVADLVRKHYLAVRVDADLRPDLANLYEDYGWPATIVFNVDGSEIVRRRGYIPPKPMASMLENIIDDPSPGPSVVPEQKLTNISEAFLSFDSRDRLRQRLVDTYDSKNKGWGTTQKFLNWDIIEYCLVEAGHGDTTFERMGRDTLAAQRNLIDPVWGGVCQYSTDGDWLHPHFEKIMQMQAEDLRIYAEAFAFWNDPTYLDTAEKIHGYLVHFLRSDDGAFYASQDADLIPGQHSADYYQLSDSERRKRGLPRIDQHVYARENGSAINALATLSAVTSDPRPLDEATRAAQWIIAHRGAPDGGFRHDEKDSAGPYLADTLYMGRAFLTLYQATADRAWLHRAESAADYLSAHFTGDVGYITAPNMGMLRSRPQLDENADLARFTNLLHYYTGKSIYQQMAEHAMKFLCIPEVQNDRGFLIGGILLANRELTRPPLHITVVGPKNDVAASALFRAALKAPPSYKRVEWWDSHEGALPNSDVEYPILSDPAAFICTERDCSAPVFLPDRLVQVVRKNLRLPEGRSPDTD